MFGLDLGKSLDLCLERLGIRFKLFKIIWNKNTKGKVSNWSIVVSDTLSRAVTVSSGGRLQVVGY